LKTDESDKPLVLAALRAKMGDWIYYITYMKMGEIAKRVSRAQSFYSSKILEELLQRDLEGERARKIEQYLISQKQRFFNSLVIGTYGGDPQWNEVALKRPTH
jgi:DNA sulfur modification protein DndB